MKSEFHHLKQCATQIQNKIVGKEILADLLNSKENYIREELEKLRKELPGQNTGYGQGWGSSANQERDVIVNRVENLLKVYKEKVSEDVQRFLGEHRLESQVWLSFWCHYII